jgi:hypothetical protein
MVTSYLYLFKLKWPIVSIPFSSYTVRSINFRAFHLVRSAKAILLFRVDTMVESSASPLATIFGGPLLMFAVGIF